MERLLLVDAARQGNRIVDLLHEGGLRKMHEFVSETAKFGDLTRGPRIVDEHVKREITRITGRPL